MTEPAAETRGYRLIPNLGQTRATFTFAAERLVEANARCDSIGHLLDDLVASFGAHLQARARWDDPVGTVSLDFPGTSEELSRIGPRATILASEALHHARAALDYVVYNAAWFDSGTPNPNSQFLLVDHRSDWLKVSRGQRLRGVSSEHLAWMGEVQPWQGARWAEHLRRLSNTDKHRVSVTLRPYYEIEFPMDRRVPDPLGDPAYFGFDIRKRQIGLLISDQPSPHGNEEGSDALATLREIVVGVSHLVNKFLPLEGQDMIRVTRQAGAPPADSN